MLSGASPGLVCGPCTSEGRSFAHGLPGEVRALTPQQSCTPLVRGSRLPGRRGARIRVVSPAAVPEEALVGEAGGMGAPTVSIEKLHSGECEQALLAAAAASEGA